MSDKKMCTECLTGLYENGQMEMIQNLAHHKTLEYFSYADGICNGCVNYLTSDRGEFPGAPKERMNDLNVLWNHFNWLYGKIKAEMEWTEENKSRYILAYANKRKYIVLVMKNLQEDPLGLCEIIERIDKKIYESITHTDFNIKEKLVITHTRSR